MNKTIEEMVQELMKNLRYYTGYMENHAEYKELEMRINNILTQAYTLGQEDKEKEVESALEDYFLSSYPIPVASVIMGYIRAAITNKQ